MVGILGDPKQNKDVLISTEIEASMKENIRTWNKEEFGNIFEDKKRLM